MPEIQRGSPRVALRIGLTWESMHLLKKLETLAKSDVSFIIVVASIAVVIKLYENLDYSET